MILAVNKYTGMKLAGCIFMHGTIPAIARAVPVYLYYNLRHISFGILTEIVTNLLQFRLD